MRPTKSTRTGMSADDRERVADLARRRDTQRVLDSIAESRRLAALVRPEYRDFRWSIIKVIQHGASPSEIADLLQRCQPQFPEIDAVEIYDLRSRCDGCWRHREVADAERWWHRQPAPRSCFPGACSEHPCGLDRRGQPGPVPVMIGETEDAFEVPPPPDVAANAEV